MTYFKKSNEEKIEDANRQTRRETNDIIEETKELRNAASKSAKDGIREFVR